MNQPSRWSGVMLAGMSTAVVLAIAFGFALAPVGATEAAGALQAAADRELQRPQRPARHPERAALQAVTRAGERLVAVGEHGVVALSDDGGQHWRAGRSGTDVTLTAVRFADARNGWATGHMGLVLRTADGGESWSRQLDGRAIAALALAEAGESPEAQAAARRLADEGPDKPLLNLLVEDAGHLTVIGAFNLALQTQDGGAHWRLLVPQANPSAYHLYGAASAGTVVMLAGERGLLLKAASAAGPFSALKTPFDGSYFGVLALSASRFVAFGLTGQAHWTDDAGASWSRVNVHGATASFNAGAVLDAAHAVLCDQAGRVFLSDDGGRSFKPLPSGGAPATGVAVAPDGALVLSTLAGAVRLPKPALLAAL